jgi:hypothetical protein
VYNKRATNNPAVQQRNKQKHPLDFDKAKQGRKTQRRTATEKATQSSAWQDKQQ